MKNFAFRRAIWLSLAVLTTPVAAGHAAEPKEKLFTLISPIVKDGAALPAKYAGADQCGGENISLPLKWANPPPSTKSYAIIMTDTDGARGSGVIHWIAYNISAYQTQLKEHKGETTSKDITVGKNSRGTEAYAGPCAPHADAPHHYTIQLLALDLAPAFIQPGLDREGLQKMISGHSLGTASLIVRYRRK
jgi:Raf kinase inhibitor-like YbhB/YbcL family protein